MPGPVEIYDVTLRDGAQGSGIKFSALDQVRVVTGRVGKGLDECVGRPVESVAYHRTSAICGSASGSHSSSNSISGIARQPASL